MVVLPLNISLVCIAVAVSAQTTVLQVEAKRLVDRTAALEKCFADRVEKFLRAQSEVNSRVSGEARIFASEQIAKLVSFDKDSNRLSGGVFVGSVEQACEQYLWKPYLTAFEASKQEIAARAKDSPKVLAPLGDAPIESESPFVQGFQNLHGRHYRGHADITRRALDEIRKQDGFSDDAVALLMRATQAPDLYGWSDHTFHAHTPEYEPSNTLDRRAKLEEGKQAFRSLLISLLKDYKRLVEAGSEELALLHLGLAAHALQDLVYHRGMTLRQHAGLAYTLRRNPDMPPMPLSEQRFREAVDLTKRLLIEARGITTEGAWARVRTWRAPPGFSFPQLARKYFLKGEDIGVAPLLAYWTLSLPFTAGERSPGELEDTGCDPERGLACWVLDDVLKPVFPMKTWIASIRW